MIAPFQNQKPVFLVRKSRANSVQQDKPKLNFVARLSSPKGKNNKAKGSALVK